MEATQNSTKPIGLNAVHVAIGEGASLTDLMNDVNCLLGAAVCSIEGMSDTAGATDGSVPEGVRAHWWPMVYTLRQAQAAFDRAYALAHEAQGVRHG